MRQDNAISYADLEKIGWPQALIEDYEGLKRELAPQKGSEADPNSVYRANLNGFYFCTTAPEKLWFNPNPGELTGWIQLV
jgi:hypothetical protein